MKRRLFSFLLIILIFVLAGCGDKKEVEERSYVVAIGLDLPTGVDLHKDQAVDVTFQFSNPKLNIKGASPEGKSEQEDIVTVTAPDFVTARNMANSSVTRELSFSHNKVIIVSEEMARSDIFYRLFTTAFKDRQIRRETNIIVTEGKASEFIKKNKPELLVRPHRFYQFLLDRSTETALVQESSINSFFAITNGDADLFLAMYGSVNTKNKGFEDEDEYMAGHVPKKGGNPVQIMGSAVFKEGKMIGKLNGEETRIARLLNNTVPTRDLYSSFPDPLDDSYKIGVRIKKARKNKIKIKLGNGPPKIEVNYPVEIMVLSVPSMINYGDDFENQNKLKQALATAMKKNAENLIKKTQKEFKSEPFYWSLYVRPLFKTDKEYVAFDWNKQYPDADVEVKMDIDLIGFGKQYKEADIEKVVD